MVRGTHPVPICAQCKKIREDRDYWTQVDTYVSAHSDAQFSHTLCPTRMRLLYPELAEEILTRVETPQNKEQC